MCTINPAYTAREVEYHLKDSGAVYLATLPELVADVWAVCQDLRLRQVFAFSSPHPCGQREVVPFARLLEIGNDVVPHVHIDPLEDVVCLPYSRCVPPSAPALTPYRALMTSCTSGTTGLPKGVCLTHFNLISNYLQMADMDPPEEGAFAGATAFGSRSLTAGDALPADRTHGASGLASLLSPIRHDADECRHAGPPSARSDPKV